MLVHASVLKRLVYFGTFVKNGLSDEGVTAGNYVGDIVAPAPGERGVVPNSLLSLDVRYETW